MDDLICCVLGVCCPPFSEGQRDAYLKALTESLKDPEKAQKVFDATYEDFVLMTMKIRNAAEKA